MSAKSLDVNTLKLVQGVDEILGLPNQIWLLGAGVSLMSGIPLMYPLTDRVDAILRDADDCASIGDRKISVEIFSQITKLLREGHHVEHVLSYLGDLISLANHQKDAKVTVGNKSFSVSELTLAHRQVQLAIRHTVEFGYRAPWNGNSEEIGKLGKPVITPEYHDAFVKALFSSRRAGQEQRPPVRFVTTNYDTLLEDALSKAKVGCIDGFAGGATGFWDPNNADQRLKQASRVCRHTATICKLHGSIDWISDEEGIVTRVRSSAIDALDPSQSLLIYPQSTKYQVTQRDPFASLFSEFRRSLAPTSSTLLAICGYSFGDDHINEEILRALRSGTSHLILVVFAGSVKYDKPADQIENEKLPKALGEWLNDPNVADRIHVLAEHGIYRGSLRNLAPTSDSYRWWTFEGVTEMLRDGSEAFE